MDACGCDGYATPIDPSTVQRDRRTYHAKGPAPTTRKLLDMIETSCQGPFSLLDVGGGIGVIDVELLRKGATRAVLVEASPAYLDAARDEAQAAGVLERLSIMAGDFVRRAEDIDAADVVTLDRVVCCYPDADALVTASAAKARRFYGLVLPRDTWFVRWAVRLDNVRWWLTRRAYRAHAHAHARIEALVRQSGLEIHAEASTLVWRVVLFGRP